jgi:hypothetical protein
MWPWSYGSWIYNYLCNQCIDIVSLNLNQGMDLISKMAVIAEQFSIAPYAVIFFLTIVIVIVW